RYRIVDFVLSNMVNSGMDHIKVLVREKPRSLIEHIGIGSHYNINSKSGSFQILYSDKNITNKLYFTDINLLKQYSSFIKESNQEYVVIAPSYMICRINYQDVVEQHIKTGADVTAVYKQVDDGHKRFIGCEEFDLINNRVVLMKVSHGSTSVKNISLETYVMHKDFLLDLIDEATRRSSAYTIGAFLANDDNIKYINIQGYKYEGYLACVNSLEEYYYTNIDLVNYEKAKDLFDKDWPIYTKTNDSPPAHYTARAEVKNCMVANGCVVQGKIENSILGRAVKIKKGAVVKDSVILSNVIIGEGAIIEKAVIDQGAKILVNKEIAGDDEQIGYVREGDTV
ncbi:MAG TPA: glucose-1-phosphate adenylyltransferase subunit GlgD, partial [Erysipelotrichaceae bacterium]|nr:glucose-1-phosphate adenylyltransferase subunit GlgD [Erysipelotrichaceae bacterium]